MTKFAAIALATLVAATALPVAAPAFAMDASKISEKCGPDGPESYKRPGGYCEQIGQTQSIGAKGDQKDDLIIIYIPFPYDNS